MRYDGVEVGAGVEFSFDAPNELIEAAKAVELVAIPKSCRIQRDAQIIDSLIISLQGHRKGMAVLAAVGERKPRGIREACRRTVHNLGDHRGGLECARPELFEKQKFGKIP